jgi:GR25 family glycosyltransferase involved in LPS biosynthesis
VTHQLPCVPVFVIFLKHRPRCAALCAALARLGIPSEMVAAANVRNYTPVELAAVYDEERATRRVGRSMGRGEIGCALSHSDVYRRMLDRDIPLALILEEDAILGTHFKSFWQASASLPGHIDVLSLYSELGCVRRRSSGSLAGCALHQSTVMLAGTVGYYIRLDCARNMLQSNTPVSMVADWPLDLRSMRQFLVLPMLVAHPVTGSTIATERPRENILRRYRAPHWFSGLFYLTYLAYVMQPDRYEGPSSYFRREVAVRLGRLISPTQINVRARFTMTQPRSITRLHSLAGRIRARLRLATKPSWLAPKLRRAKLSSTAQKAKLKIGCYTNWLDFHDALRFLTPNAAGVWNDVAFVPAGSIRTDWVGIFNQPRQRVVEFCGPNRVFFAIGEPPTCMHRPLHLGQGPGTTVFTCDRELVKRSGELRNYVLTPPMLRTWSVRRSFEQLSTASIRDKPRKLSWITSNVSLMAGHRRRLQFLARLREGLEFDLYGRGFRRVDDKWDGLASYRYSIAFENFRAPYYFTEKLMDCFVCETMPIYIGDPTITNFFPPESLMIIDPDAPDVIEQIRCVIESDAWNRNRDAILEAKRRVLHEYNVFAMLSRLVAARTAPASPPVKMRFIPVKLAPEEDAGVA